MKLRIYKFDPAVDAAPYYLEGEVPYKDKMTLLEAIVWFHENIQEIAYDYSCHGRWCGRCAVMLDGEPKLACCTPITDGEHTIDPLRGFTVIRDLMVDKHDMDDRLSKIYQRVRTEPLKPEDVNNFEPTYKDDLYNTITCARCGLCDAACPIYQQMPDQFAGPSAMLAIAFRYMDPYDQADRVLEAVSNGLYHCILCGKCDQVCQRYGIEHVKAWKMLREAAEERGLKPSYAK